MRQQTDVDAVLPRLPRGSGLAPERWQLAVDYARNLREPGEPALVTEWQGKLQLEWLVADDGAVGLWRIVLLDPEARTLPRFAEDELRASMDGDAEDFVLSGTGWLPLRAFFGIAAFCAAVWTGSAGFPLAGVVVVALLVAAAMVPFWLDARRARIWRQRRLLIDGDATGAAHAHELVVAYVEARERGDASAAEQMQRQLWERAVALPGRRS